MTAYEELQQLRGVGGATAQGLATAGFTSLLRVASAEPVQFAEVLLKLRMPVSLREGLIARARALTGYETSALAARKRVALARLLVEEIGKGLLKTPASRSALLKRLVGCPASRARIIQNVVADLG